MHVSTYYSSDELARGLVQRATIRAWRLHDTDAVPVAEVPRGQAQLG